MNKNFDTEDQLIIQTLSKCDHLKTIIKDVKREIDRCPGNNDRLEYIEEIYEVLDTLISRF